MAVRDLLVGQDPEGIEKLQDSPLPTQPSIGVGDMIGVAIDRPSITGGGLARWAADKLEGSRDYSPEELTKMYPEAPEGTFTQRNTKRMGDWLNKRALNEDLYSNMNKYRSLGHSNAYNTITDIGYGIVQETSPTDIGLGLLSGGLLTAGSAAATASIKAGSMNLGLRGLSYLGQNTTKAIIASEAIEGLITIPLDYGIRKALEGPTQTEASLGEAVLGGIGGAAISSSIRLGARQFAKYLGKIHSRLDPETRRTFGNALEEELNFQMQPGTDWEMNGKFSELEPVRRLPVDDRLKYKVYSAAEAIPRTTELGETGMFSLYNNASDMSHNGAATPFGQSVHISDNVGDLEAFSASIKQKGQLVQLNPEEFNILKTAEINEASPLGKEIKQLLNEAGIESPSLKEGLNALREMDDNGPIEFELQEMLKEKGYDGISFIENHKILDKNFSKNNTFIFDGISGKTRRILKELDGSLGGLPESTAFFQNTKANALKNGEGYLTNGKQIKLDPQGYFNTDPFYGNPEKGIGFISAFSKEQIDDINTRVEVSRPSTLKKKYQGLTDDTIEYVKQLNIMKEFEDASSMAEKVKKLPEEWEPILKDILDTETEIQLVEKMMVDQGNFEANKELIQKTVEQQAKEGKATRILEEADFESLTKKFVKRVEDRIGTPKESQTESIIRHYQDSIENLKKNNPEIIDEIIKATDFCLRKYTK